MKKVLLISCMVTTLFSCKKDLSFQQTDEGVVAQKNFSISPVPVINSFLPTNGHAGTIVTINGTNLNGVQSLTIGGQPAIVLANTSTSIRAFVMPGTAAGAINLIAATGKTTTKSLFTLTASSFPAIQQGAKLVGAGGNGQTEQGGSVSISADGNTAVIGGNYHNYPQYLAWVYTRSGTVWTQQGNKVVGTGTPGKAQSSTTTAVSADGNTAILGNGYDNNRLAGAAFILTRTGSTWNQQIKLIGSPNIGGNAQQGSAVAMSADGKTVLVGGPGDNNAQGAGWIFTNNGGIWTQQAKLVGKGNIGAALQGGSVALSADGNTAALGGVADNGAIGAVWIFVRNNNGWVQQGTKLTGSDRKGAAQQGYSVSLSADGNMVLVGGINDNGGKGAAWLFARSSGVWGQLTNKLIGSNAVGNAGQGGAVSLSADGSIIISGAVADNNYQGAVWFFKRTGNTWLQQGNKVTGIGGSGKPNRGTSVMLSADGSTGIFGGPGDNNSIGASWIFAAP